MDEKKLTVNSTAIETLEWLEQRLIEVIADMNHDISSVKSDRVAFGIYQKRDAAIGIIAEYRTDIISLLKGESI